MGIITFTDFFFIGWCWLYVERGHHSKGVTFRKFVRRKRFKNRKIHSNVEQMAILYCDSNIVMISYGEISGY